MNSNMPRFLPVACFLLLATAGSARAVGTVLDVNFVGTLVDQACTFEQEDQALDVTFPVRALKYFEHYSRTTTEPFVIGLKNCASSLRGKLVDLTFTFPDSEVVDGTTMLKPAGDTGLLIGLLDGKGDAITPGQPVEAGSIAQVGSGTLNHFTLGAYVMAPPGVTVKAGTYSATTTFTVSYR